MPLPLPRQGNPKVYLPGYRSLSYGGFDAAMAALPTRKSGGGLSEPKFDQGQLATIDKTGLQFNANQLISLGLKQPAYAMEAPLRPLDVATGGLVKGITDTVSKVPVLSNILGAAGDGLQFLDNVGASLPNHQLADWLARASGQPDNYVVERHEGRVLTAGEVRARAQQQWATDQKGNAYTLPELEARAKSNPWSFGEFATSTDAGGDIVNRLITNPLNLLFVPGLASGAARAVAGGAKYLAEASQAAGWARPVIKAVSAATPFRYGYGYAASLGRGTGAFLHEAHNPTPLLREFTDVNAGATAIMNGNLRAGGTMKSLLTATSWLSRGAKAIYLPGINTELKGARLAGSAARAWMRGGIQQELVGAAGNYLFGGIDNYLKENGMDHSVVGGVTSAIHNALSEIMNDHPLSDNNAYVLASMFLPWSGAGKDIVAPVTRKFREARLPAYGNNVAAQVREKLNNRMGTKFKSNDEFFTELGNGDLQRGKDMFLWWTDTVEVMKAKNQFSHLFQQVGSAEMDGLATLTTFFGDNVRANIERRRATGALKPASTADYMFETHFTPGLAPKGATELASEVSGTADSFMREIRNMYQAREAIGPQLESLGLDITNGGILDRERMDAIIAEVQKAPEGQVSQDFARQIIDMGPNLVYDNEFWRQFAITLGQEAHGGVIGKAATAAENVTRDDLIARLTEVRDKLPSQQELFHETIQASKAQGVAKNDVFRIRESPFPLGEKVKANRLKAVTRVEQLADNERTLHTMRSNEYFKSGKPKFSTASEITGPEGGVFKRVEPTTGMGSDGVLRLSSGGSFGAPADLIPDFRAPKPDILEGVPKGEPGGISFNDVKTVAGGSKKQAIWYGPDGEPKAYAQVRIDAKGNAHELSVYVDPEFRRRGIATMLYDKFKLEGIDLSKVSGSIVTAEGKAFTDKYWSKVKRTAAEKPGTVYARADGVTLTIKKGVASITIPADREANLLKELDKTIFKSGPRKGQIKPGMEEQSAKLNLQIEAARMGIDTEALILAAQNVGRIIVADTRAGDLLAQHGFVESAKIGKPTRPEWVNPGPAPELPKGFDYKAPGAEAAREAHYAEYQAWHHEMNRGVYSGKISPEEAYKLGWMGVDTGLPTPPMYGLSPVTDPVLYHATGNMPDILARGLRTREDIGRVALGGGPSHVISFTGNKATAERIKDVLVEAGQVLRGEKSIAELAQVAKKGGFYKTWSRNLHAKDAIEGRYVHEVGSYSEKTKRFEVTGTRPMSQDEIASVNWELYNQFLISQELKTGLLNPYFFASDWRQIAKITPASAGVVAVRPHPGVLAEISGPMGEQRLFPDTFDIIGDKAAYSFRGGDPTKILENRAAGAFAPYRPSKRVVSEKGAIGLARRDAINASLYVDATHYVGRSSNPTRTLFPDERLRYIKEQGDAIKTAYGQELKGVAAIDSIAFDMLPFDKKITDMNLQDWADALSTKEYGKVRDFFRDSYSQYPNMSLTRREPGMVVDPAQSRFTTLVTTKNRWQEMFMDYGPLSPIQRLYDAVLAPISVRWLGKQTQTEVHNLLATVGWEPNASRQFIAKLRARVLESRSVRGVASITGSHTFRSVEALPEETLRAIAREVAPDHAQAVLDRWGDYQKMLTEASNRLLRSVQRKTRMGGSLNPIERAADNAFRFYQYAPGVSKVSFAGQRLTKFVYPWFRFHSDPFFHLMNFTEPSIYAILNNGWRGLQNPSEGIPRRMELSSAGLIPPGGLYAKDAPADLLLADAGTYTAPHNILPRLQREYELTTDKKAIELFDQMTRDHPVAVMMRERFGDNIPDWAAEMNRLMENLVKKPEGMVRAEWKDTLEKELGYSHAELKQLAPVAERLTEIYRGVHNDLTDLYIGRMNRGNFERLANTFFLAFPISYMIKVTAWAYRILFEKLGPVQGSLGAYMWDQYRQKYENAVQNDPSFAKWTQDNADFLFALEMTMPVTPASIGININKTTRYVGSWLSQEWLGTPGPGAFDVPSLLDNATRMGPLRTIGLAGRLMKEWQVPGFYHPAPSKVHNLTPY